MPQNRIGAIAAPVAITAATTAPAFADGENGDFGLLNVNGTLTTAIINDETGEVSDIGNSVLITEFESLIPGVVGIDEPGFFFADGEFAAGAELTYNHRGPIREWTGSDFGALATDSGNNVQFIDGSDTEFAPASGNAASNFSWTYGGTGDFDEHPDFALTGNQTPGIYLWEFELVINNDPALTTNITQPLFLIFGWEVSDDELEIAEEYVETVLVPTPGALAVLGGAGLVAARRRRA